MSTWQQRCEAHLRVLARDDVTLPEAVVYLYNWLHFERAIYVRNKNSTRAAKYLKKMDDSLTIFTFRTEMMVDL